VNPYTGNLPACQVGLQNLVGNPALLYRVENIQESVSPFTLHLERELSNRTRIYHRLCYPINECRGFWDGMPELINVGMLLENWNQVFPMIRVGMG